MADETPKTVLLNELAPPPSAHDSRSQEILRTWVTGDGGLEVGLISAFDDPGLWGLMLADIARHAARAYEQDGRMSYDEALAEIKDMFEAEWDNPTDPGTTEPTRQH